MLHQPTLPQQSAFLRHVAKARLARFRSVTGGNERQAVELYILDSAIASHLHALCTMTEVILREAIHRALSDCYEKDWYIKRDQHLDDDAHLRIAQAMASAGSRKDGKVVAEIQFGTWCNLLGRGGHRDGRPQDYRPVFWEPALKHIFTAPVPGDAAPGRNRLVLLTNRVRWARNRINHCEPVIFGFPQPGQRPGLQERRTPAAVAQDMRTLVGFIDADLGSWLTACDGVDKLVTAPLAAKALFQASQTSGVKMVG